MNPHSVAAFSAFDDDTGSADADAKRSADADAKASADADAKGTDLIRLRVDASIVNTVGYAWWRIDDRRQTS